MLQVKTHIAKHQLVWILTDCLDEEEIVTLANQCGILHNYKRKSPLPKNWFANDLARCFFDESSTERTVSQYLGKKAEQATRRVQYMRTEEIQTFLKSAEQLQQDGEFGEMLWALLMDSREEVRRHGYKLLTERERSLPPTTFFWDYNVYASPSPNFRTSYLLETETVNVDCKQHYEHDEAAPVKSATIPRSSSYTPHDFLQSRISDRESRLCSELEKSKQQIDKLSETVSSSRSELAILQNENDALNQKIAQLAEENQKLKNREQSYKESESRIHQLERENKNLRQEIEKFSNQLCEFHGFQLEKDKLSSELKSIEEVGYRTQQALEQMQSDFHTQLSYLHRVNEEYRVALTNARKKITTLANQRHTGSGNYLLADQPRVGVFVDVQNMFYAAKDRYARRLDYIKLLDLVVGPRNLVIAYAYVVQIPEINQSGFLSLLEHNGYTIKSKDLRMRGDGSAKGDWDVGIAIDVMSMLNALDVVILASGDGDFCALAEIIKRHGKRIEVVAFEHNTSMDLQRVADQFFPIGDEMLI